MTAASGFFGRRDELKLLDRSVTPRAEVAVTGLSGVGKSALVAEWARRSRFTTLSVDCAGLSSNEVANAVLARLGRQPAAAAPGEGAWVLAAMALQAGAVETLVLDGLEIVVPIAGLRNGFSGAIVTTSVVPPHPRAAVLPLEPLPVPTAAALDEAAAFALFVAAGRRVDLRFDVAPEEREAVTEILFAVGGIPLAIELAAFRAATLGIGEVHGTLGPAAFDDPSRPARHRSIDAALDASWSALTHRQRRLLYGMCLFPRPVRVEVLADLCDESPGAATEVVSSLLRCALVCPGPFPRPLSALVAGIVRRFQADEPHATATMRARVLELAVATAAEIPRGLTFHGGHYQEGPSLWQFALADPPEADSARLGIILAAYVRWRDFTRMAEGIPIERLLELAEVARDWNAWLRLAAYFLTSDLFHARACAGRARECATNAGERHAATVLEAEVLLALHDLRGARLTLERAFEEGEETVYSALCGAQLELSEGDVEEARRLLSDARRLWDGVTPSVEVRLCWLSAVLAAAPDDAVSHSQRAVALCGELGIPRALAISSLNLAETAGFKALRFDIAIDAAGAATQAFRLLGDTMWVRSLCVETLLTLLSEGPDQATRRLSAHGTELAALDGELRGYVRLVRAAIDWLASRPVEEGLLDSEFGERDNAELRELGWLLSVGQAAASGPVQVGRIIRAPLPEGVRSWLEAVASPSNILDSSQAIESARRLRTLFSKAPSGRWYEAIARAHCVAQQPKLLRQVLALSEVEADIAALPDFSVAFSDGEWRDLSRHDTCMRLLAFLASQDGPADFEAVADGIYPGEIIEYASLQNRVNVQVSRLRKLGFKRFLVKQPEGFRLAARVVVVSD